MDFSLLQQPRFSMGSILPRILLSAVLAAAVLAQPFLHADASAQSQRTVIVSVQDRRGAPVPGMTPADFRVREDGRNMTVVAAEPARTPLTVAIMIDNSGAGLQSMREGAAAVIARLRGIASIALYTTSGRTLKVQDFTDSPATLIAALNKVFSTNQQGSFLTDGIVAVTREFEAAEAERPAIISVGVEGEDFSEIRPDDVLAALQRTGTRLFMVRLGTPVLGQSRPLDAPPGDSYLDEQVRFNALLGQAPGRTGGRLEQLWTHTGIPTVMDGIASELATQYEVTYAGANLSGSDLRFQVSTSKRDVRVRGPQRVGPPR
jgi:VWFA-related protein